MPKIQKSLLRKKNIPDGQIAAVEVNLVEPQLVVFSTGLDTELLPQHPVLMINPIS